MADDDFQERGFLGQRIADIVPNLRADNFDWFALADDANIALTRLAEWATGATRTTSMSPEAVAVRLLLRSCGLFQGVVLLIERGMVAEGRTLTRSLIENAFGIGALIHHSTEFMAMLREDSEASRQSQRKFILAEDLIASGATRERLQAAIEAIEGRPRTMSPKALAGLGPLKRLYLSYQRLSDGAVHLSAASLDRHVSANAERTHWCYRWGPGEDGENAATLHHAISAAISVGVGTCEFLENSKLNAEFAALAERFSAMPPVPHV